MIDDLANHILNKSGIIKLGIEKSMERFVAVTGNVIAAFVKGECVYCQRITDEKPLEICYNDCMVAMQNKLASQSNLM